jgi:hypothetical protein
LNKKQEKSLPLNRKQLIKHENMKTNAECVIAPTKRKGYKSGGLTERNL